MKTKPMSHQLDAAKLLAAHPDHFAVGAEQGTGKTWMLLDDIERQYRAHRITAALIIAPKGVHTNWVLREIPAHMSEPCTTGYWLSGMGKRKARQLTRLLRGDVDGVRILAMNVDAVNTKKGFAFAKAFLQAHKCMMIVDESQRIKNPKAKRTTRVCTLGTMAVSRRISSGTLVANGPLDLFGQYEFLRPGLLGTTSYRAFVAQYAELLPDSHPVMQELKSRNRRGNPQVVRKDESGAPIYKNVSRLQSLIAPHTYRVTKAQCMDLPPKIYQTHYFELAPVQRKLYDAIKKQMRLERPDGDIDAFTALTVINKLRQVTSGFVLIDGEAAHLRESKPRLSALTDLLEDMPQQVIIWASFREELDQLEEALCDRVPVTYHGGTPAAQREAAVDAFQSGEARTFIANPAAGGTGLTLTAAQAVVYYSNSFSLEQRSQSEDRSHRIGTTDSVVYIDLVARDTIDEKIAAALQMKKATAAEILDGLW